jgi:hypothetical protein
MMDIHQKFSPTSFAVIEWRLKREKFVAPADLALAIAANPDVALPAAIRDYLIHTLRGEVEAPRGRKPGGVVAQVQDLYAAILYERYRAWLRTRRRRLGLPGWTSAEWNQGPPHERAARMVERRLRRYQSWRHIVNLVSQQR